MGMHIRKKRSVRKHKGKEYVYNYFEIIKTYRDPDDKSKVISKFIGYLGKDKKKFKLKLKEIKWNKETEELVEAIHGFSGQDRKSIRTELKQMRDNGFLPTTEKPKF